MLVLFETPAGYALFKVANEGKLKESSDLHADFSTPEKAAEMIKLKAFSAFDDTSQAVAACVDMVEGKMGKALKKFLTKNVVKKELTEQLAVADAKLGSVIKEKLEIKCVNDSKVQELMRGIRSQLESLLAGVGDENLKAMRLGVSHSLSRYKLKFSADKVDTMIVQAIGLLDELDKEVNTYAMRVREWYGWHFPEMAKVLNDNMIYAKCVLKMGTRDHAKNIDFSDIMEDENMQATLKAEAETSMGTEITVGDTISIKALAEQVVSLSEYRIQLYDYLKNRMNAIAPNLSIMVGELVGARLIAHAGSLLNLAKQPASTVQILGAEKALFRALKTKHDTPKYGLIYHASMIGQTSTKNKGKISRVLAAKTALAVRVDAMGDTADTTIGLESRAKVEARIRQLDGGAQMVIAGGPKTVKTLKKYDAKAAKQGAPAVYNIAEDTVAALVVVKKKKDDDDDDEKEAEEIEEMEEEKGGASNGAAKTPTSVKKEKKKKDKSEKKSEKKKRKERDSEEGTGEKGGKEEETASSETPKSKKKKQQVDSSSAGVAAALEVEKEIEATTSGKKKKRKAVEEAAAEEGGGDSAVKSSSKKKKKKADKDKSDA